MCYLIVTRGKQNLTGTKAHLHKWKAVIAEKLIDAVAGKWWPSGNVLMQMLVHLEVASIRISIGCIKSAETRGIKDDRTQEFNEMTLDCLSD